jgi:hypothetical protein
MTATPGPRVGSWVTSNARAMSQYMTRRAREPAVPVADASGQGQLVHQKLLVASVAQCLVETLRGQIVARRLQKDTR